MTPEDQRVNAADIRAYFDLVAQTVVDRAQEMIRAGTPIETAFKLCIAWELDKQCNAAMLAVHAHYRK